jgi:hypothetical protein
MLKKLKGMLVLFLFREVKRDMDIIYATLIVRGYKTYQDVPDILKEDVRKVLVELEVGELAP